MNTTPEDNTLETKTEDDNPEILDACQFTVRRLQSWYGNNDHQTLTLTREDVKELLDDVKRLEGLAAVSPQDPKAR